MFSYLTEDGESKIDIVKSSASQIKFTRFQVGYINRDNLPNIYGTDLELSNYSDLKSNSYMLDRFVSRIEQDNTKISYIIANNSRLVLKLYLPPNNIGFTYNTIFLFAEVDDDEVLFSICYSLYDNPNFSMAVNKGGTKYYFIQTFDVPDVNDWFDVSNINLEVPDFEFYDEFPDIDFAHRTERDQLILYKHPAYTNLYNNYEKRQFVVNSSDDWYGVPLLPYTDLQNKQFQLVYPTFVHDPNGYLYIRTGELSGLGLLTTNITKTLNKEIDFDENYTNMNVIPNKLSDVTVEFNSGTDFIVDLLD